LISLNRIIATLFFSGYAPIAPGTAGTAVVAVIYWLYFVFAEPLSDIAWLALLVGSFLVAVYTADKMAREWGKDPGRVVVDEGVGFLVTVAFLPPTSWTIIVAFFVFRILDIIKPTPARQLEALPGGWGIVLDDVMAGIYGNLVMRLFFYAIGLMGVL
jgi:phosphatidylglycerophosphatase A